MIDTKTGVILIVDDALDNIKLLNAVLKNEYRILFATDGEQALQLAVDEKPDLILMDISMPSMNGYQVCQRLKASVATQAIPVMFVTGRGDTEAEVKAFEVGAVDYITKPINPRIVKMRVRNQIDLKLTRDNLVQMAVTDSLTGLANRRYFDEILHTESQRLARLQQPLSLILLDVDYFKRFNDEYGHVLGDQCLQQIAQVIRRCLSSSTQLAARYGGEEFVCILPNMPQSGAVQMAEQIRHAIATQHIPHRTSVTAQYVTSSLGVFTVTCSVDMNLADCLRQVDAQLYLAKKKGRNRVCFAENAVT